MSSLGARKYCVKVLGLGGFGGGSDKGFVHCWLWQGVAAEKRTSCHPTIHIYLHFYQSSVTFEQLFPFIGQLYAYMIDLICRIAMLIL